MKFERRFWDLLRDGAWSAYILTVMLGVGTGIVIIVQAALLSEILDLVYLQGADLIQVRGLLLTLVVVLVLRAGTVWGREQAAFHLAMQVVQQLRERLLSRIVDLGPAYTEGEQSGSSIHMLTQGLEDMAIYFRHYLPQLAIVAIVPFLMFVVVLWRDWPSGLIFILTAPLIPLFMVLIGDWADALTRRQWMQLSRMRAFLLETLQGLTTLKQLGQASAHLKRVSEVGETFRSATMRVLRVAFLSSLVMEWVATLSTAVISVGIGLRLLSGALTFRQSFFVLLLAPEFYQPLRRLGTSFHAGMSGIAAADRIFALLGTAPQANLEIKPRQATGCRLPHLIRFEHVSYTYPGGAYPAVRNVSFSLQTGQWVALVGPSGAGKSTLISLLLRFISPLEGRIWVDDTPLEQWPAEEWYRCVSWVSQHPYLFHGSIAENLRLARPQATLEEIERAVRLARLDETIHRLPRGYQTRIGERGALLSGGEAQRLALARAFLKDAPVLLLDEPTSGLDPDNDRHIQAALQHVLTGRTSLIIAHRIETVRQADLILVLSAGQIVQSGTHQSLLAQEGLYRQLVRKTE